MDKLARILLSQRRSEFVFVHEAIHHQIQSSHSRLESPVSVQIVTSSSFLRVFSPRQNERLRHQRHFSEKNRAGYAIQNNSYLLATRHSPDTPLSHTTHELEHQGIVCWRLPIAITPLFGIWINSSRSLILTKFNNVSRSVGNFPGARAS